MTTSSCSGRISLFKNNEKALKGGKWLIASHDTVTMDQVYRALEYDAPVSGNRNDKEKVNSVRLR